MLQCLQEGRVLHEERSYQEDKNLLATGQLSEEEAIAILNAVRGTQAKASSHHYDARQKVWIMQVKVATVSWYIKAYLREENRVVFLSFHRDGLGGERL